MVATNSYLMKNNYQKLLVSSTIIYAAMGIFTPAWYLFLTEKIGSAEFGLAIGLMAIAGGVTAYFTGRLADIHRKKIILFWADIFLALITLAYVFVSSAMGIYALQLIYGVIGAISIMLENIMISLFTTEDKRGQGMGLFSGVQQVGVGVFMILGGFLVPVMGIKAIFILVSILILLGAIVALSIKEEDKKVQST